MIGIVFFMRLVYNKNVTAIHNIHNKSVRKDLYGTIHFE